MARPGAIDRLLRVPNFADCSGCNFGRDIAIDGTDNVPETLSGVARIFAGAGSGYLASWADFFVPVISSAVGSRSNRDQLRGYMRNLLPRGDSVCRHSHNFADTSDACCVFTAVPAAVRPRL